LSESRDFHNCVGRPGPDHACAVDGGNEKGLYAGRGGEFCLEELPRRARLSGTRRRGASRRELDADELSITMDGMSLSPAQGVAEATINFQEAGDSKVATTGDFVLTADEVNPVISALEEHHIAVTALHSHMLTEQPRLFFMHFWAADSIQSVADGIKAALSHIAIK